MDWHDVDENERTVVHCGNTWNRETQAGITHRDFFHFPTYSFDFVASSNMKNSQILYGFARCRRKQGDYLHLLWTL